MTKHYPVIPELRRKTTAIGKAMQTLARLEIAAKTVHVDVDPPVIDVFHCPGNSRLRSVTTGQGVGHCDQRPYAVRQAMVDGCRVTWQERL